MTLSYVTLQSSGFISVWKVHITTKRPGCWERLRAGGEGGDPGCWERLKAGGEGGDPGWWERLRAGGEGGDRGCDGWMASRIQWT